MEKLITAKYKQKKYRDSPTARKRISCATHLLREFLTISQEEKVYHDGRIEHLIVRIDETIDIDLTKGFLSS